MVVTGWPTELQKEIDDFMAIKGKELSNGFSWYTEATRDAIRHYAMGLGDENPLWSNEEYAKKTRYGGIIAPPQFPQAFYDVTMVRDDVTGQMGLPSFISWYVQLKWKFHQLVRINDKVKGTHSLWDLTEKTTRNSGRTILQETFVRYTNQRNELVAERFYNQFRLMRENITMDQYMGLPVYKYSKEELQKIDQDYANETQRGAVPRYWEDVEVGEQLPPIVKGPWAVRDTIAYWAGRGCSVFVPHRTFWHLRTRTDTHVIIDPETDLPELQHMQILKDSVARTRGSPRAFENGDNRAANVMCLLTNWMGDDGFLKEFDLELRRPVFVGDTYWCNGTITGKREEEGQSLVDLELKAINQSGVIVSPGRAVIQLPSRTNGSA